MAALESTPTITITINDQEVQVPAGELIVESVKRLGLEIPIFCYHPRLKPVGMCRMCLVEVGFKQPDGTVRKMPKPQAACTLPASKDMVVYTDTEAVERDRLGVLEFLLINHPLDCPICDRGGECPLQNNVIAYGPGNSRFIEPKRRAPKAVPLSDYVTLDLERCIQCGRCVRFTEEISGDGQLAFRFRGSSMQPSTFKLTDFASKFSGNVIEICPVGALTSSTYRFRARPWDLETREAICMNCSIGCNIWMDHRNGKYARTNGRTNEAINEEWTCDRGKFGSAWLNSEDRLTAPLRREGDRFVPVSWGDAYAEIMAQFAAGGNAVGALVGGAVSNEGLYMLQKLFRTGFQSNNLDHRWTSHLASAKRRPGGWPTIKIADLEHKKALVILGTSLADELPIIFLRVRKAWFKHGARVIVVNERATEADSFAAKTFTVRSGSYSALASAVAAVRAGGDASDALKRAAASTGLSVEDVQSLAAEMTNATVITSHSMLNEADGIDALENFERASGEFTCYALGANDPGAAALGILPDRGPGASDVTGEAGLGTWGAFDAAVRGSLKALWLIESDPFSTHGDRATIARALENVDYLVVQASRRTEVMAYASIVLPMEAPAEHDGTYMSADGHVQRMKQVLGKSGDAKQAWRIYSEILMRLKGGVPAFGPKDVFQEICNEVPAFQGLDFEELAAESRRDTKPTLEAALAEVF